MIHAMVQGTLMADPQVRTAASGKTFATAQICTAIAGEDSLLIGMAAFAPLDAKLAVLKAGDPVAVTGALKPNNWTDKQGRERHSWNLTVSGVMTLYEVSKRKKAVAWAMATADAEDFPDDALNGL